MRTIDKHYKRGIPSLNYKFIVYAKANFDFQVMIA